MKLTQEIVNLICDLEYKLGSHCVQEKSLTADWLEYRYPVSIWVDNPNDEEDFGHREKIRKNVRYANYRVDKETITTLQYNMGKNRLDVGKAIIDMLELLEKRYGLDFNKLEKEHRYPSR